MCDARVNVSEQAIASLLESSLFCESFGYIDRINFANKIVTDRVRTKGEQRHYYELVQCKTRG